MPGPRRRRPSGGAPARRRRGWRRRRSPSRGPRARASSSTPWRAAAHTSANNSGPAPRAAVTHHDRPIAPQWPPGPALRTGRTHRTGTSAPGSSPGCPTLPCGSPSPPGRQPRRRPAGAQIPLGKAAGRRVESPGRVQGAGLAGPRTGGRITGVTMTVTCHACWRGRQAGRACRQAVSSVAVSVARPNRTARNAAPTARVPG